MNDPLKMLSTADLEALQAGDFSKVSTAGLQMLQGPAEPAALATGKAINKGLSDIPRQIGLTARYAIEGPAQAAQIFTEPVAGLMRASGIKTKSLGELASGLADSIGLPLPQNANERVISDATRLGFGAGGMGMAAGTGAALQGMAGKVMSGLAANPAQQLSAAAGAGLLGGSSREAGGSPMLQAGASLLGGVAGGAAAGLGSAGTNAVRTGLNKLKMTPQDVDLQITAVLNRAGVDYSQLPGQVRNSLRSELTSAIQAGKEIDPAAVARLADFRTVGAAPTRGMVTQNPVQITREMNLAKMGANTSDEGLQGLALLQNQNNATFIRNLNDSGAARGNALAAGESVTGSILGKQASLRGAERSAWNDAKNSPGYRQPIESNVISDINQSLGDEAMMPFLNPTISRYMEAFQTGQQPFTPQAYRNLQSMLSNEMSKGGNEAAAAGLARRTLEQSQLRPITNPGGIDFGNGPSTNNMAAQMRAVDAAPGQSIEAVNQARSATRAAYAFEDSSTLVRSALSDGASSDPARIAQRFVIGGTPNEAAILAQQVGPSGQPIIRDALVAHLKDKALSGAADEVGKFSQSAYNKALRDIGERKLALFFSPEEVAQLQAVGRVSSYAQVQPVGSAVNNSNSGALMLGRGYDMLKGIAGKVPGGQSLIIDPLKNIEISLRSNQAKNLLPGLLLQPPRRPFSQGLLLPGLAAGGGLLSPQ